MSFIQVATQKMCNCGQYLGGKKAI